MFITELSFRTEGVDEICVYDRKSPAVAYGGIKSLFVVKNVKNADDAA